MNHEDLHEKLERMGREPVPEPRKEFVDSLLPRLQMVDDLTSVAPTPAQLRQPWARLRLIAVGGVAAVLLGAVGFLSLVNTGNSDVREVALTSSSGGVTINGVALGEDGETEIATGDEVVCDFDAEMTIDGGAVLLCPEGVHTARVTMDGDTPVVELEDPEEDEVAAGDVVSTTTEAPATTSTTATPQSTGQGDSPTTESTSIPGIDAMGPLSGSDVRSNQLSLSWEPWDGVGLDHYAVLRTMTEPGVEPDGETCTDTVDAPRYGNQEPAPGTEIWLELDGHNLSEPIDLVEFTHCVAYRVVALDANGNLLAETGVMVYALEWSSGEEGLPPATAPPKPTTTVPPQTTPTTAPETTTSTTTPSTTTTVADGGQGVVDTPTSTTAVVEVSDGGTGLNGDSKAAGERFGSRRDHRSND